MYDLFSSHGHILEVKMKRNFRMRGQAFVIFEDEEQAKRALTALDGFLVYGKPMMVNYARNKSDLVAQRNGEVIPEETKTERKEKNTKFNEWVGYIR